MAEEKQTELTLFADKEWSWDRKKNRAFSSKNRKTSKDLLNDRKKDHKRAEDVLLLKGDESFLSGDLDEAVYCYEQVLELRNPDTSTHSCSWAENYLQEKLLSVDSHLECCPHNAGLYIQKASVLFLQEKWDKARVTISLGIAQCQDKSDLKALLHKLNKLEKNMK